MALQQLSKRDWTPERAAHLLNRAGFGGSPHEVEQLHGLGLTGAVAKMLNFRNDVPPVDVPAWANLAAARREDNTMQARMDGLGNDERRKAVQRVYQMQERARLLELRAWWLYRMCHGSYPLQEKMTLFLHGHFATSFEKVRSAYAMFLQNQTFRSHATGSWSDLVRAMTRDPAMLIYLDGIQNTREAPNENFAREVMELFTLGEGHYTEQDIGEAARAFTGWRFDRRAFEMKYVLRRHDDGQKIFMKKKGNFDGDDIVEMILGQPQAASWIVMKLWTFFAYQNPEPEVVHTLADTLRRNDYVLRPVLEQMFLSRAFYGQRAVRTQVKSPVQWLVSTVRYLEASLPEAGQVQRLLDSLGQSLFEPPNVKGWDGGVTWVTTSSLALRYSAASEFVRGGSGKRARSQIMNRREELETQARDAGIVLQLPDMDAPWLQEVVPPLLDWEKILPWEEQSSREQILSSLQWRLYQSTLRDRDRLAFERFFATLPDPDAWKARTFATALEALTNTPQFQLT